MFRIFLVLFLLLTSVARAETITGRAEVADGDTLTVAGIKVRLHGIDAPELDQTCQKADGLRWACGRWSRDALLKIAGQGKVTCEGSAQDRYGRLLATCTVKGADIGRALVRMGAAEAYRRYSTAYVDDEKVAAIGGLGLWQGRHNSPEAFRAADVPAPQAGPGDCVIKGNISGNGHIYHLPGQENYDDTRISPSKGERWFCSEAEARAAGWRRARR